MMAGDPPTVSIANPGIFDSPNPPQQHTHTHTHIEAPSMRHTCHCGATFQIPVVNTDGRDIGGRREPYGGLHAAEEVLKNWERRHKKTCPSPIPGPNALETVR